MAGVTSESTVVVGGDSVLPKNTSSNFRELDDAYLQTQARIWLGEVLQIRLEEHVDISDLLADGELLIEVSEVISRMLPTLPVDETQIKMYDWKNLGSNKSTRRYMPYHNVDSFLRMCKNLGIDGIDLFTPSDVVERRNTRKVCMCLRSLSKKSRLRKLNVPDFDSVTCTLAMPTDMVECIRKSLEMSQSSSSLSVEQEAERVSRVKVCRRMSNSASTVSNGYSDSCDEVESRLVVRESYGSSDDAYDAESPNISGLNIIREYNSELQLRMRSDFKNEDDDQCEYLSPSNAESVGSHCSHYCSDEDISVPFPNGLSSRIDGKVPELNTETDHGYQVGDLSHVSIDWGDSLLDVGNYKDVDANANDGDADCASHGKKDIDTTCSNDFYLAGNDMCNELFGISNNPSIVDWDKSSELGEPPECVVTDDSHAGEAPHMNHEDAPLDNVAKHEPVICEVGPDIGEPRFQGKTNNKVLSGEHLIQSSCAFKTSENSVLLYASENQASNACTEVTNAGENSSCDKLNNGNVTSKEVAGHLRSHEEKTSSPFGYDEHSCNSSSLLAVKANYNDAHWIPARFVAPNEVSIPLLHDRDTIFCSDLHCSAIKNDKESFDDNKTTLLHIEQHSGNGFKDGNANNMLDMNSSSWVMAKNNLCCSKGCQDAMEGSEVHKANDKDNTILVNSIASALGNSQQEDQFLQNMEDTENKHLQNVKEVEKGESGLVKQEGADKEITEHKPQRKLLKSVAKGTALVGVVVFLLHLRKNRQQNLSIAKKRSAQIVIQGSAKPSQKPGSMSSVYPADKLNLGM